jgi:penicillin-binding protein 1A
MIGRYGNDALYEGGLSVRTTLDPKLQAIGAQGIAQGPDQL